MSLDASFLGVFLQALKKSKVQVKSREIPFFISRAFSANH